MKPLVSVITPVFNSKPYLSDTINSVLKQSFSDFEYILIDDDSTDGSFEVIKEYSIEDSRIKIIKNDKNYGAAVSRNKGIEAAKGKYIAFIDSDDIWVKDKLERHIKFMQENDIGFSFTSYKVVYENSGKSRIIKAPEVLDYRRQLFYNHIGTSTVIYNVEKLGKVYMKNLRKRQDYATWLYILRNFGNGYGLDEVLTIYRVRKSSLSSNKLNLIKYNWQVYRRCEGLSLINSMFYLFTNVIVKLLRIK